MNQLQASIIENRLTPTIARLFDCLHETLQKDMRLAGLLEELGKGLLDYVSTTRSPESQAQPTTATASLPSESPKAATISIEDDEKQIQGPAELDQRLTELPEITFASSPARPIAQEYSYSQASPAVMADLSLIETRCRLKAEACRWQVKRNQLLERGADFRTEIQPLDAEIISRARGEKDCFLWMCNPNGPVPADISYYEELADCFELCADSVALLRTITENPTRGNGHLEQAMDFAAEAQSMLRVMLLALDETLKDSDQNALYQWLRHQAQKDQILIQRHMRIDDGADPRELNHLRDRIQTLDSALSRLRNNEKNRRSALNKIRYHLKQITQKPEEGHEHDWQKITETVQQLMDSGLAPSNLGLRDTFLPYIETMPKEAAEQPAMQKVLNEIDRYLASRPTMSDTIEREQTTASVEQVAELLNGKSVLMVGGELRVHAKNALETAFKLRELIWMKTREHNPRLDFDPDVSRPDVAVVLLAIRWSRHSYADVEFACEKHGKPLVRLPAGYNPNQVAEQILAQCSDRLSNP